MLSCRVFVRLSEHACKIFPQAESSVFISGVTLDLLKFGVLSL